MRTLATEFAGQTVTLTYPDFFDEKAAFLFGAHGIDDKPNQNVIAITEADSGSFILESPFQPLSPILKSTDLPEFAMEAVLRGLVTDQAAGIVLHAGAVERRGKAILVSGISGAGKSTLTAWLSQNGFNYLTDELVFVPAADPMMVTPFRRPLVLRADSFAALEKDGFDISKHITVGDKALVTPPGDAGKTALAPGAIIYPSFTKDADISIIALSPSQAVLRLLENNLNGANLADGGLSTLARLANSIPAFELRYGDFEQLEDVLDTIVDDILEREPDPKAWHRIHSAFGKKQNVVSAQAAPTTRAPTPINPPTPSRGNFKLTIGMATYDDFDGVYFSIQSLRLNNPELAAGIEFLVIDNHPDGPCGDALKALENQCDTYRYVPFSGQSGTAIRDMVFSEASGEFVLCMDCHVLLAPGTLERVLEFIDEHKESTDLYQGPMIYDRLDHFATHFVPEWKQGMYGTWGTDERAQDPDAEPFDIPMQGLGLFLCKRSSWPGFNLKFHGFGGEEGYIHEKFRQRGDRTLCLPFLRWLHRFPRPMGVPYKPVWEDRIRNYTIGHRELGLNEEPIETHFNEVLGKQATKRALTEIARELANPFNRFDALRCINLDDRPDRYAAVNKRFEKIGISRLVKRFPAIKTPENHHIGCALSHRAIIEDARQRGLQNIFVFEDDVIFHDRIMERMPSVIEKLATTDWDVLYLGGYLREEAPTNLPKGTVLRGCKGITCTHAVAYNERVFDRLLEDIPADYDAMAQWLDRFKGFDHYLSELDIRKLVTVPMLAMQQELVDLPEFPDEAGFVKLHNRF